MKGKALTGIFVLAILISSCNKKENEIVITNKNDLLVAINQANDGDTLYVGDIDFRMEPQLHKSITRISLSKNITIKNGLKDKKAVFTSGSFNITGTRVAGENTSISFEDIIFDGDINGRQLTDDSWLYDDIDDLEPRMCQYAMLYKGNVSATYSGCDFSNYMNENGGAIWGLYGDYSGNEAILTAYGDNSSCKLNITIDNCSFKDNYSYYGGGAIYLEGNKENITISLNNSSFTNNNSSCMDFAQGGGACFLSDLNSSFTNCLFDSNNGSYSYGSNRKKSASIPDGMPEEFLEDYLSSINDQTAGGAVCVKRGSCEIKNSIIKNNNASLGGGIGNYNAKLIVDGCVFHNNTANCDLLENPKDATGPWSMMGLGGAVYINSSDGVLNEFWNTSFIENTARNGYGSIYSFYNGSHDDGILVYPDVNVNFCSFKDNKETITYDSSLKEWSARPGNGYEIPHIKYNGCFISDELCVDYFNKYEQPSFENKYCYYTNATHLLEDQVELSIQDEHIKLNSTGTLSLTIPNEFVNEISQKHYKENEPKTYNLGSNYSSSLYKVTEPKKSNLPLLFILTGIGLLLAISIPSGILILKRKKKDLGEPIATIESNIDIETNEDIDTDDIILKIKIEYKITNREEDVLRLLLQGKKRIEIANTLFLSESAIKKYTASIYSKIGVHSKVELIMKYKK